MLLCPANQVVLQHLSCCMQHVFINEASNLELVDVAGSVVGVLLEQSLEAPALPCLSLSCPASVFAALPCPALPCPALPCPALPCPALPWPALPCPALPCPALPCPALPDQCIAKSAKYMCKMHVAVQCSLCLLTTPSTQIQQLSKLSVLLEDLDEAVSFAAKSHHY